MSDFWRTFLSTILGITAGYLSYLLQYYRSKRIESKSKIKLTVRLLNDFITDIDESDASYAEMLKGLSDEIYKIPKLKLENHPAIQMLVENIQTEEYQNAFTRILGNANHSEDNFYSLRTNSWISKSSNEKIQAEYLEVYEDTDANKGKIAELFKNSIKKRIEYSMNTGTDKAIASELESIFDKYDSASANDHYIELRELENYLINPLIDFFDKTKYNDGILLELRNNILDMEFILQEYVVNYETLIEDVEEIRKSLSRSQSELKKVLVYFNAYQIKSLYV